MWLRLNYRRVDWIISSLRSLNFLYEALGKETSRFWCFFPSFSSDRGVCSPQRSAPSCKLNDGNDSCSPTDSLWRKFVRYHIPGMNPKGTKSPFLLLEVNCKSRCHFSWLPQTAPSSAARPIICWPVIYLVTSFPPFLASFIHTRSPLPHFIILLILYPRHALIFPSPPPCSLTISLHLSLSLLPEW